MAIRNKPVDAVVIGMGWTGSIMAMELANAGLSVVGFERGDRRDTNTTFAYPQILDEVKYSARHALLQDLSRNTVTVRHNAGQTAVPYRQIGSFKPGEGVGGAGIHWSGVQSRVMPDELRLKSHVTERYGANFIPEGMQLQDWGITYDELEPHFDRFEKICGTSGKAGNLRGQIIKGGNPFEGVRSDEYPLPPLKDHNAGMLFAEAAAKLGYNPFPLPAGNASGPYTNPYGCQLGPCSFCGFCSDYGCFNYSKASPNACVMPALERHPGFTLKANSEVLKVNLDSDGKKAVGVTYMDAEGREVEQPAELVVMAAFHFHNVRLMLLSGIGKPYDHQTGEGVVGRNFVYQVLNNVTCFFDKDTYINPFMGTGGGGQAIEDLNADNFDHGPLGFIGGAILWGRQTGVGPVRGITTPSGVPKWGTAWKQSLKDSFLHATKIEAQGSNMAYRDCFLDLDPTYRDSFGQPLLRMTFDWKDNDMRMSEWTGAKLVEVAKAMGAKQTRVGVKKMGSHWDARNYQSTHIGGGTAMGSDPSISVLNKYLQSWDVSNVFVLGSNTFAHGIGYNPTGLVGGLAVWAAHNIREQYLKNPGPMVQA